MIDKTIFQLRYKLAQFLIADELFNQVINKPNFADLSGLALIQHDKGFYLTALRIVEFLTQIDTNTPEDAEKFKEKIVDNKTLYFLRQPLEKAANENIREKIESIKKPDDLVKAKLFDTLVLKGVYETYFAAYVPQEWKCEFLDEETALAINTSIPVNAFSLFDTSALEIIEGLFDLTDNTTTKKVIKNLKKHPYISSYVQFLALAERYALVK